MLSKAILAQLNLPADVSGRVWRLSGSYQSVHFHRHAELELNVALSGHATYIVGNERIKLVRRSLLWLHPAQNHILIEASPDFSMTLAVWKPEFLARWCQTETSQMLLLADPSEARLKRIGEDDFSAIELLSRHVENAGGELLESGLAFLLHLAHEAFERAVKGESPGAIHPCVERAARLLRDQSPPPSVPDLAREVGLSPSRLSRLFKSQTGASLTEFRARGCHERALRLLESDLPLSQVAERAGFGSYAQFHRTFCVHQGQNPARFRRGRSER